MEQIEAMTPLQARLNFLGFLVLAVGITVNALYFQDASIDSHKKRYAPAPEVRDPARSRQSKPGIKPPSTASIPKVDFLKVKEDSSLELVAAIQRELLARKYKPARDGSAGIVTRAAILAYEFDHGLPLTATPNEQILQNIIFGVSKENTRKISKSNMTKASHDIIREVQKVLQDLEYFNGKADGFMGKETRKAIRKFEKHRKIKLTGRVSGLLLRELFQFSKRALGSNKR